MEVLQNIALSVGSLGAARISDQFCLFLLFRNAFQVVASFFASCMGVMSILDIAQLCGAVLTTSGLVYASVEIWFTISQNLSMSAFEIDSVGSGVIGSGTIMG